MCQRWKHYTEKSQKDQFLSQCVTTSRDRDGLATHLDKPGTLPGFLGPYRADEGDRDMEDARAAFLRFLHQAEPRARQINSEHLGQSSPIPPTTTPGKTKSESLVGFLSGIPPPFSMTSKACRTGGEELKVEFGRYIRGKDAIIEQITESLLVSLSIAS